MLSRIADSLYWLNRYMERADGMVRLVAIHYSLSLDKDINKNITWKPVLETFTLLSHDQIQTQENDTGKVLNKMLVDTTNSNSLKVLVNKARENARGVQDHITKEVWEQVNHMYHLVNNPSLIAKLNSYQGLEVLELFMKQSLMYAGVIDVTMSRGLGWQFMNLGKYVERCLQTIVLTEKQIQVLYQAQEPVNDIFQWRSLLLSLSGYELHLKTYRSTDHSYNVLHQVILNDNFTRSLHYSLRHIEYCLNYITATSTDDQTMDLMRCFGRLYSKIKYMDLNHLEGEVLSPFLEETKFDLLEFSRRLGQHFFSYS